jgi:starvation-inducible DNA-binding protein
MKLIKFSERKTMSDLSFTVPTLSEDTSKEVIAELQNRLAELNDLALTLKHVHWNVKGANFIAVHEMIDPQVDIVRDAVDEIAERIATLGGSPNGLSEAIISAKIWTKYPLEGREDSLAHLRQLDNSYVDAIVNLRNGISKLDELDVISSNILQDVTQSLEQFQWFVRSHLI